MVREIRKHLESIDEETEGVFGTEIDRLQHNISKLVEAPLAPEEFNRYCISINTLRSKYIHRYKGETADTSHPKDELSEKNPLLSITAIRLLAQDQALEETKVKTGLLPPYLTRHKGVPSQATEITYLERRELVKS